MLEQAFEASGKFFRGNIHTHSDLSDGVINPQEVCRRYQAEGYDFISLTDHFVGEYNYPLSDTRPFRDNTFTTLIGAELHSGAMENGDLWHILAVGLPLDFEPSNSPGFRPIAEQESGPQLAKRAREAGAFVAVAHPEWSGLTVADARSIEAAHAIETYNHGCAVGCDRGNGFHTLDLLLSEGKRLNLCATDDAHFDVADHFGGWVMVKAEANEPELLLDALKAGRYYSSQGPEFRSIEWSPTEVNIECSAVETIVVQGHGSAAIGRRGNSITRINIRTKALAERSPWMRVTLIDKAGRKAWSNPVWHQDF